MRSIFKVVFVALALSHAAASSAQSFPSKPLRMIVPYPPGGGVDAVARIVAARLSATLGQTVTVENRSGAAGVIGADAVAKSAPNGYTMLIASPAEVVIIPGTGGKTPYNVENDLLPVTLIGETPLAIAVPAASPIKSIQELLAQARSQSSKIAYGSPGQGSSMHFAGASLEILGKIDLVHVPYRGAAPVVVDLVGGQLPLGIVGMPPVVGHAKSGKLRVLAVTSERRSSTFPDVPAVAELPGFAGFRFTNWMGVFVPARTPTAAAQRLADAIIAITKEPETRERLDAAGVEPAGLTAQEFVAFMRAETLRYARISKERGITATSD